MGNSIKVYITKIESNTKGALVLLSNTHSGFIKRLFELDILEINEGLVLFQCVIRES